MKSRIAWNKGLTKETDKRVRNYAARRKGMKFSKAHIKNISESHVGLKYLNRKKTGTSWNAGLTKETDDRIAKYSKKLSITSIGNQNAKGKHWKIKDTSKMKGHKNAKGQKMSKKGRIEWLKKMKGRVSHRKGMSYIDEYGKEKTKEISDKISLSNKGRKCTDEAKEKYRIAAKKKWQDLEYAKKVLCVNSPNKEEICLSNILNEVLPDEYIFVGDGKLRVGRKFPDFVNKTKPKLIELYGDFYHKGQNPQDRIDYFKQYGYNTLVIWASELNNKEELNNKILNFK